MLPRAYAEEQELFDEIFYWAPAHPRKVEVDFLLKRGRELLGIGIRPAVAPAGVDKHRIARKDAALLKPLRFEHRGQVLCG